MDSRWSVSWIDRQSFSEMSTTFAHFPVISTGSCDSAISSNSLYSLDLASVAFTVGVANLHTGMLIHNAKTYGEESLHDKQQAAYSSFLNAVAQAAC